MENTPASFQITQRELEDILMTAIATCEAKLHIDLHTMPAVPPDAVKLFAEPLYGLGPNTSRQTGFLSSLDTSAGWLGSLPKSLQPITTGRTLPEIVVYRMSLLFGAEFIKAGEANARYNETLGYIFSCCKSLVTARGYSIVAPYRYKPQFLGEYDDVCLAQGMSAEALSADRQYWKNVRDGHFPNAPFERC